jgi:hydrogenase nickel incorporation protein HypA/HybF
MHELAITESVVECVADHVRGAKVLRVVLVIGKLSGVVPDAVRACFDICAEGTVMEGASLDIEETPGRARCRDCEAQVELLDTIALCPCGSANLAMFSGQELKIRSVEVV